MAPCHGCLYLINMFYWLFLQKFLDFVSLDQVPISSHQGDVIAQLVTCWSLWPSLSHPLSHPHQTVLFKMQMSPGWYGSGD